MTRNTAEVRGQQYIVIQTDDPAVITAVNALMPVAKTSSSLLAFEKQPQPWERERNLGTPSLYESLDALFTSHMDKAREAYRPFKEQREDKS